MSEADPKEAEVTEESLKFFNLIHVLSHRMNMLVAAAKAPTPPPTVYHNDPALVAKIATLTTKVDELENLTFQSATLPPPPTSAIRSEDSLLLPHHHRHCSDRPGQKSVPGRP